MTTTPTDGLEALRERMEREEAPKSTWWMRKYIYEDDGAWKK